MEMPRPWLLGGGAHVSSDQVARLGIEALQVGLWSLRATEIHVDGVRP